MKGMKDAGSASDKRTEQNINLKIVIGAVALLTVLIWLIPAIPVSLLGALIIVVFGFFFAAVSLYKIHSLGVCFYA